MAVTYRKVALVVSSAGLLSYLLFVYYKRNAKAQAPKTGVKQPVSKPAIEFFSPKSSFNDCNSLSRRDACLLTNLIASSSGKEDILQRVLTTVANKAAFTENQDVFREVGCLQRLTSLAKSYSVHVISGSKVDRESLRCLLVALNNLAMNVNNQTELQDSIPSLLLIVNWHATSDRTVTLAALQALTNLSVTSSYHSMYVDHVDVVVQLALTRSKLAAVDDVRLQSMKLLVNLTSSHELVHRLVALQNPSCFLRVLDEVDNSALTLRALNLLVNLHTVAAAVTRTCDVEEAVAPLTEEGGVSNDVTLPSSCSRAADRPFMSREYLGRLRVTLDRLVRHEDQDIRTISLRLVSLLPSISDISR